MDPNSWVSIVAAVIGSGGLAGAAYLMKARPEAGSIVVDAANKIVVLQRDMIKEQEATIKTLRAYVGELEAKITRCDELILKQSDNLAHLAQRVLDLEQGIAGNGHAVA